MSYFGKTCFLLVLLMLLFTSLKAQDDRLPDGNLAVGATFNTNLDGLGSSLPFWLHANKQGLYDQRSANSLFYTEFSKPLVTGDQLSIQTSGRIIGRAAEESTLGIHRLSATANYGFLTLRVGKFVDPLGMNYHPLSSGSMQYSMNAEPVPKVVLQTDGFVDVPLSQGYVQFSSYLGHGWFENARYVKNSYIHQKYFYLKVNYKMLEGIGGIIHNVQWGGDHPTRGQQPSSFKDFWRVLWAKGAGENSNAPGGEISNVLGNSVAAYDFNLRVNLDQFRLTFYRLFYLEDKVSTRFRSPWDGMWGGGIIRTADHPVLKSFLYEHINTKRQDSFDFEPRGSASYYNNSFYPSGWTYKNRVLGNPLLLTDGSNIRPVYNNIIIAHHLGARGFLNPNVEWTAFYTFSRNYGEKRDQIIEYKPAPREETIYGEYRPMEELKKINHSLYFGSTFLVPQYENLELSAGIALDVGELYSPDRVGLTFSAKYNIY
ncbi:capsule assembly Wzi family protein [Aliifodinibius sp. S!AR15-10]|uniref:capsule assembly Wzi family protein n=1 Tax=Aliifodinibius sp. S!AR15-10 TaxID=2950437 RepID=UPI0028659280|nr:capsule assembly Wzi family protein [Aliifodinibius sp. S!AR15-10]MDR8391135.1 capsule assembly Wzi family protein [Aliifodinibius sp. S!AR15-10]